MQREIKLRPTDDSPAIVICADTSGSMRGQKIERLRRELSRFWREIKASLIAFDSSVRWIDEPNLLPSPGGSTDMAGALDMAASVWPSEVIVISDGMPDDETAAIQAAMRIPGTVSVLFVGSDDDRDGLAFMRRLATVGGGTMVHKDLAKNLEIANELRGMLALPPPIAL